MQTEPVRINLDYLASTYGIESLAEARIDRDVVATAGRRVTGKRILVLVPRKDES